MQQRRGREVHKLKATYFAGYAFQRFLFGSLYPTMKKKNPKSYSSSRQDQPPRLPPRLSGRRCWLPARRTPGTEGGSRRCTLTGSPQRQPLDVGPVPGREKAPALAGLSQIKIAAS